MLGIHFAGPNGLFEPLLQILVILLGSANYFIFGVGGSIIFVYSLFTEYYYLPLLYSVWLWYDQDICERGGRKWEWLRGWSFWKKAFDYFPIQLIKTSDLDPNKNYIIGYHPHGIIFAGAMTNFLTHGGKWREYFPGITTTLLALKVHLCFPFGREYLLAAGVASSSKESIEHLLTKNGTGNGVVISPGGTAEVYESHPNTAVLVLKKRKGFVKMALTHGASLVPIFTFGETDLYSQIPNPEGSLARKIQNKFKNLFGIPLILAKGNCFFFLPRKLPLFTVVGKPIDVERIENPSQEDIDKYHAVYMDALKQLFDEYKGKLDNGRFKDQVLVLK